MNVYEGVSAFYQSYRGEKAVIGESVCGRRIYALFVGTHTPPLGICQYAMHARESITADLALWHVRRGLVRGGVWVVPLVNPDGALLVQEGAVSVAHGRRAELLYLNGSGDFSKWKANARGVDLNVNFDARWGTGAHNVRMPGSANYVGIMPFSEPESKALRDFTRAVQPQFTVSYHTKGEEIYWRFHQPFLRARRDKRIARRMSAATGYPLREAPHSAGGYKDWCIEKLGIPALTVEAGRESFSHPLGLAALSDLVSKNLDALVRFTEEW